MKKILMIFITVIVLLGLFNCKTIEDLLNPNKSYGEYTSIKLSIKVTFKGLNSLGIRTISVDENEELSEDFFYQDDADDDDSCVTATTDVSHTFQVILNKTTCNVKVEYTNWDYVHYALNIPSYKLLCAEWTAEVLKYSWEEEKNDPGAPSIGGLEGLVLDINSHCQANGERKHNCVAEAELTLTRSNGKKNLSKVYAVGSNFKSVKIDD